LLHLVNISKERPGCYKKRKREKENKRKRTNVPLKKLSLPLSNPGSPPKSSKFQRRGMRSFSRSNSKIRLFTITILYPFITITTLSTIHHLSTTYHIFHTHAHLDLIV
jgi:hypothetical protein